MCTMCVNSYLVNFSESELIVCFLGFGPRYAAERGAPTG